MRVAGEEATGPARRAEGGLLSVLKAPGPTSQQLVNRIRRLFGERRVGHAGTLDPAAAGLMLVGVGRGTRLLAYLLGGEKRYLFWCRFGLRTETGDAEGRRLERTSASHLSAGDVEALLPRFQGRVRLPVPIYSAAHVQGERAYRLARQGRTVHMPEREVHIESLVLRGWEEGEQPAALLDLRCSAGTYVRSLCARLGEEAGTGAVLDSLLRVEVGGHRLESAWTLEELEDLRPAERWEALLPPGRALPELPRVTVDRIDARRLRHGQPIRLPRLVVPGDPPPERLQVETRDAWVGVVRPRPEGSAWLVCRPEMIWRAEEGWRATL
ncbi:MAG: tRNA pseudouridine(55) synthase TruB [Clostridia bacterium]|nr:tRNA pseudouridine(55) synthase TruB [Clostridia bacterium]